MDSGINSELDRKLIDPDVELIHAFNSGDVAAFDSLYQRHSTYIYNTCLGILGNPDDARDAMQETFVQLYRSLSKFRGQSRFLTWLYRIAVNKCTDLVRRRPKWESTDTLEWVGEPEEPTGDELLEEQVRQAILRLRPDYRAVLVLFYFQRLSYEEMAESLDCTTDQVRIRLHRARQQFRTVWANGGGDVEV